MSSAPTTGTVLVHKSRKKHRLGKASRSRATSLGVTDTNEHSVILVPVRHIREDSQSRGALQAGSATIINQYVANLLTLYKENTIA